MATTTKCIQCPDGSWLCGSNPRCPRPTVDAPIAVLGEIRFEIELWENPGAEPPYAVRLKPVVIEPEERAKRR